MATDPKPFLTLEQYLAVEREAGEFRSEYEDGQVFPMEAAGPNHGRISSNLVGQFYLKLRGGKCRVYSKDLLVQTGAASLPVTAPSPPCAST